MKRRYRADVVKVAGRLGRYGILDGYYGCRGGGLGEWTTKRVERIWREPLA